MASTLSTLSTVFLICALLFFVMALIVFFALNIPSVIGYLSGRKVRKSISEMRLINEKNGTKSYNIGKINSERGKITSPIESSHNQNKDFYSPAGNVQLFENEIIDNETEATELLNSSDTEGLENTALLVEPTDYKNNDTEVLNEEYHKLTDINHKKNIQLIEEIIITHTNEVI